MNITEPFNFSSSIFIPILVTVLTTSIISIIGRIINHYRNQIPQLFYTESINYLTQPMGGLEVSYKNKPIPWTDSLYFVLITLFNESRIDVQNIKTIITAKTNTILLNVDGYKNDFEHPMPLTDEHREMSESYDQFRVNLDKRRDFNISVLNRGDNVRFFMLVTCQNGSKPNISIDFEHVGVKLKKLGNDHVLQGISIRNSLTTGIVLGIISTILTVLFIPNRFIAIIVTGLSCLGCLLWGNLILRLYR